MASFLSPSVLVAIVALENVRTEKASIAKVNMFSSGFGQTMSEFLESLTNVIDISQNCLNLFNSLPGLLTAITPSIIHGLNIFKSDGAGRKQIYSFIP